jgi:thymidine kinase
MTEKLTVISGPMFAGKTDEMLRRLRRAEVIDKKVQVFKPRIDDRWGEVDKIGSHSGGRRKAFVVASPGEILEKLQEGVDIVAISEVQFMDIEVVDAVLELLDRDIEVIVDGLPTDFKREPFGVMPILLALADEIEHLTALCDEEMNGGVKCGEDATLTQRFVNGAPAKSDDPVVVIGAEEQYAARCYKHHKVR